MIFVSQSIYPIVSPYMVISIRSFAIKMPWHNLLILLLFYFDMLNFGRYFVLYAGYIVMPIDKR